MKEQEETSRGFVSDFSKVAPWVLGVLSVFWILVCLGGWGLYWWYLDACGWDRDIRLSYECSTLRTHIDAAYWMGVGHMLTQAAIYMAIVMCRTLCKY
jgi:hypothetical protein